MSTVIKALLVGLTMSVPIAIWSLNRSTAPQRTVLAPDSTRRLPTGRDVNRPPAELFGHGDRDSGANDASRVDSTLNAEVAQLRSQVRQERARALRLKSRVDELEGAAGNASSSSSSKSPAAAVAVRRPGVFPVHDPATRRKAAAASVVDPGSITKRTGKWLTSSHICSARDFSGQKRSDGHSHCHFKRLCIAPGKGPPPKHAVSRGHYDWYYLYDEVEPPFLNFPDSINFSLGVGPHQGDAKVHVKPKVARVADFAKDYGEVRLEPTLTHIFYEYNGENFGHMLTDVIMPMYAIMAGFDVLDYDVQLVRYQIDHDLGFSCDYQRNPGWEYPGAIESGQWKPGVIKRPGIDKNCKRFYDMLVPGVSSRPALVLGDLFNKSKTPVCFEDVLLGTPSLSDDCNQGTHGRDLGQVSVCNTGRMEQFWSFRSYVKANLGVAEEPPKEHHVVVWNRPDGRRRLNDLDKICSELRTKLKVKVTLIDWATLTITEQLRLIGSATVHVTGPGGGSFIAIFLPRGATSVRLYSAAFGMEFHFFNFLGYIHPVYRHANGGTVDRAQLMADVKFGMRRYEIFNRRTFPQESAPS